MKLELKTQLNRGSFNLDIDCILSEPVTGLFGPSGSGKTTLLHMLAGLVRPQFGRIALNDELFFDSNCGIDRPPHRRRLGIVFQDECLFPHFSIKRNLRFGEKFVPHGNRHFQFDDVVDLLELGSILERRPGELSGGERRRVALGRALLSSPAMLLLDEPLTALDRRLKQQIMPFLRRVRDITKIPMLYVSHDLSEILELTNYMVVIHRGKMVGQGPFLDLIRNQEALDHMKEPGLLNILELTVHQHDQDAGISVLKILGGETALKGPFLEAPVGSRVQAGLRPEDIALALSPIQGTSIQNQLPGRITRLIHAPDREACVVDIGIPLLVEITHNAMKSLELTEGKPIWCLFKSRALRHIAAVDSPRP